MAEVKHPYLNCPLCPSQAFYLRNWDGYNLLQYRCSAQHTFFIEEQEIE